MRVEKGRHRMVIILPSLGIVLKFPRIYFRQAVRNLRSWKDIKKAFFFSVESVGNPKGLLFLGIVVNWREFVFYLKSRHPFLQPTFFSLLGLVNIQRYGKPCPSSIFDKLGKLLWSLSREIFKDAHHFVPPENFCYNKEGRIRIVDYGSIKTRQIIEKWGLEILETLKRMDNSQEDAY